MPTDAEYEAALKRERERKRKKKGGKKKPNPTKGSLRDKIKKRHQMLNDL